jgi:hypothetical protein
MYENNSHVLDNFLTLLRILPLFSPRLKATGKNVEYMNVVTIFVGKYTFIKYLHIRHGRAQRCDAAMNEMQGGPLSAGIVALSILYIALMRSCHIHIYLLYSTCMPPSA